MPRIMALDRFYMDRFYNGGETYEIGEATLQEMKDKKMTHHIERLDKKDAEIEKATQADLDSMRVEDLRELCENLGIEHEKLRKAELITELRAAIAAKG